MATGVDLRAAVAAPERRWAHDLRAKLQTVTGLENFRQCGEPWAREVRVVMAPTGETRRHGIHSCTCVWVCPVCWSRRRIQERAEIAYAGGLWFAAGAGLATGVLTVPHHAGEPLEAVLGRLEDHVAGLRSGAARERLAGFGVDGILRATEITHGLNGWHPHIHLLFWLREPWDEPARAGMIEWWRTWRRRHWEKKRHSPLYKPEHDPYLPDVQTVQPADLDREAGHITKGASRSTEARYYRARVEGDDELAAYLAPFMFGEQAADGDPQAMDLWAEYETATARRHWLTWPRAGFRERFGLGPAGREPALEGEVVAVLPGANRRGDLVVGRGFAPGGGG